MVSHYMMANYPRLFKGAIINCGIMDDGLRKWLGYPSGKNIVFMINPGDFRYKEITSNCVYIKGKNNKKLWLEFPGGHQWAPPEYYVKAMSWLNNQATLKIE